VNSNIFPNLNPGEWAKINLDTESKNTKLDLTNPATCTTWLDSLHKTRGVSYSYGGFLENRSTLWRNHYNKQNSAFVHVGIDYNVPAGTEVALPLDAKVLHIMKDEDQFGGWGGRVLVALSDFPFYMIFGHLKKDILLSLGRTYNALQIIGIVGTPAENGGWYSHLHVQIMDKVFIDAHQPDFTSIDGYLKEAHLLLDHVVNPEEIIFVQ